MPPCRPDYVAARGAPAAGGRHALTGYPLARGLLGGRLLAAEDLHGVGDHLAGCFGASGYLDRVAIASLHLVGAELHPHAAVLALVYLCPLEARGGAHPEASRGAVGRPRRPPGVDGIGACRRDLDLEARGNTIFGGVDVGSTETLYVVRALPPAGSLEASRCGVVHNLRIAGRGPVRNVDVGVSGNTTLRDALR